ncbi:sulfotransferase domain-containing protein [Aureimonas sp. AU22]|uniref:sulfotransferase domain-containing protein n=1 Tax=Aureimonas sp. AU22 TaxID=1638162 RepID=UPI0007830ED2
MTMMYRSALRKVSRRARLVWTAAGADTFLASYPKSGRTWFRSILSHYFASVVGEADRAGLHEMFGVVPNYDSDPVRGIPAFRYGGLRSQVPLIVVTHHLYRRTLFLNRPVVFMVRDPRDVLVSAYFHETRHKRRFSGELDAFIAHESLGVPALIRYLNAWGRGLAHHRNAVLSYEDLSADTQRASAEIIAFLGHPLQPTLLGEAVRASRFEAMRQREIEQGIPAHEYDRGDVESLRMRRGKPGGFGDYLTQAQAAKIVSACERQLTPAAKALVARTGLLLN